VLTLASSVQTRTDLKFIHTASLVFSVNDDFDLRSSTCEVTTVWHYRNFILLLLLNTNIYYCSRCF